ncbi:hypothetical protein QWY85_15865 [Neolewinella lacunae]|uniref:Lipoprotein n=1 Tax=Neolewinella lacunae TaxID=1517758 RepID=A0A923T8B3_9BACT|nr:hypothetical protein [Neolewinella lacunae]MBC6993763.1 hypothetical protein [Neolewinella lacunae]MDN3636145.1 hypothetical protein [Neolewinella lacunae]
MKSTICVALFALLPLSIFNCNNNKLYVPAQHEALSNQNYEIFKTNLVKAYESRDHFEISFQLANLKAPKEIIYDHLRQYISEDIKRCENIYEISYLAEQGFIRHLYAMDTIAYQEIFALCELKDSTSSYAIYKAREEERTRKFLANRPVLDSLKFDLALIEKLKALDENDQKYRRQIGRSYYMPQATKDSLWKLQEELDAINLLAMDSIFTAVGYPVPSKVGYEYSSTFVYILHHQTDGAIREKFTNKFRSHLSLEEMELLEERTASLKATPQ